MPALPHPLTLEDRALSRNRSLARRALWAQTLFVASMSALLAGLALMSWGRVDAARIANVATWMHTHASTLALTAIITMIWSTRLALRRDAIRHAASAHAALPVWQDTQRQRDTHTRWRLALRIGGIGLLIVALLALHDATVAMSAATSLRWSLLAALLAVVFTPAPRGVLHAHVGASARLARVPRWLAMTASAELPHLPQWWWQRAGSIWMRGRAATVLAIGLLLAPMDAAAILLPIALLTLAALLNALDVAHRLAADIAFLLAARPPSADWIRRALSPLHAGLCTLLAMLLATMVHLLGVTPASNAMLVGGALIAATIDLLLAIVLRHAPRRLGIARTQIVVVAAAVTSAFAPLLPLFAVGLLIVLARQVRRNEHDA